ncbi:MAG TPA: TlpA disulfide reductase family protein [Isosphaeraceae bacterium]|jgi:peroxiredoxin|nr:TlpA disulfide reductase family protein [Isosphaeraceae bacterium]
MSSRSSLIILLSLVPLVARADDTKPAGPPFKSVTELQAAHDRAMVKDLTDYIQKNPKAEDIDQAYMALFNKVIDHDWFADHEAIAKRYLDEQPQGAVRLLAHIVVTMSRALAGELDEAMKSYSALMKGLDKPDQEEFAVNFADAFATTATTAGDYTVARKAYEALLKQFPDSPTLRQKVKDDLARLERVGKPAPRFNVKDTAGKAVRLEDFKGKYLLLDFWATWCGPCLAELPNLKAAYAKYHDRGFDVVGVSLDDTPEAVTDFIKTRKIPWHQVHNSSSGGDLVDALGVTNIPATYLVGPDGVIVRLELRGVALDQALDKLLKAQK